MNKNKGETMAKTVEKTVGTYLYTGVKEINEHLNMGISNFTVEDCQEAARLFAHLASELEESK